MVSESKLLATMVHAQKVKRGLGLAPPPHFLCDFRKKLSRYILLDDRISLLDCL